MPTCTACRHANPEGSRYCGQCGTYLGSDDDTSRLPDTGERRYLTVLFCDLVGSTLLSEELNEEDYREVVRFVHDSSTTIIERLGGHLQYLGDGILVLFGYPHAHEDDAARAVHAALEVQEAIRACPAQIRARLKRFSGELHSRAAVHTGPVVMGAMDVGSQRPVLALGKVVNVAAHLQKLAGHDCLLITESTRRLLGEQFVLEPQGRTQLHGIKQAIETFRVIGIRPAVRRHDITRRGERTPLVGRVEEMALLAERWEKVVAGQGQIVVISGEPGIGKSRLLAAVKQQLSLGTRWFEVNGSQYHESSELWPVLELLQNRVLEGATGSDARERLANRLDAAGLGTGDSLRLLSSLLALPESQDDAPITLMPGEQRRRILESLIEWIWRLTDETPAALVVEDLQWLDPTSMDLLRALVANLGSHRAFILLTCRTSFEPSWDRQANELRLVLNPLTAGEALRLVEGIAGDRTPPANVMRDVLAKSDGVPLFLEEVTRMLVDSPTMLESVPENLRELLQTRLDQLPAESLDTTRISAVVGRRVSRELLLALSSKPTDGVDRDLRSLLAAGIMVNEGDGYAFKHVLLRDTAYDRMLLATRTTLHDAVARTLLARFPYLADTQPELVAHHFTQAGVADAAFQEWSRAGARSLRNGAYLEAVHHFDQALTQRGLLPDSTEADRTARAQEELRLRKDLGVSLIATQGYTSQAVAANYEHALRRSSELNDRDQDIPIHVLYGLWGTCLVRGDREATDELARHFQRVEESPDPLARHVAHSTLGARAFYHGDFTRAMQHCRQAMEIYAPAHHFVLMRDYGYEGAIYSHSYVACILCFTGFPDQARVVVNEALELSRSVGDPYSNATSLCFAACIARERREPEQAMALADELIALATERQFVMWLGIAHCLRGWSRVAMGDIAGGAEEIRFGLGMWEATGAKVPGTYLRLNLIEAELAGGEIEAGLADVEQGMQQCRRTLESYQQPEYHRLKGELLRRQGNLKRAEREIQRALDGARAQGATWVELHAALSLARLATPDRPDLLSPLAAVYSRLTEGFDTRDVREAASLLAAQGEGPVMSAL